MLEANGRAGVPLYPFYPKAAAGEQRPPIVLPELLTAALVLREIREDPLDAERRAVIVHRLAARAGIVPQSVPA